jgi:phage-related holin
MKTFLLVSTTTTISFICTYLLNLTLENSEQYLAVVAVALLDGFFGVIAGIKREGFKTYKALKVLQTIVVWIIFLTTLLIIEQAYPGTTWLSETIIFPFVFFQVISALKNASMAGFIEAKVLTQILDKIDLHKGEREHNKD